MIGFYWYSKKIKNKFGYLKKYSYLYNLNQSNMKIETFERFYTIIDKAFYVTIILFTFYGIGTLVFLFKTISATRIVSNDTTNTLLYVFIGFFGILVLFGVICSFIMARIKEEYKKIHI